MNAASQAVVFRAISDPTRRAILDLLTRGALAVREILTSFSISQPAVSKHLRILREAGLVSVEKAGRERLYHLEGLALRDVADWVAHYEHFWTDKLDTLGRILDETA